MSSRALPGPITPGVFLEAREPAQAVMDFYLSRLVLDGWIYLPGRKQGFARVDPPEESSSPFWHRARHAYMGVTIRQRNGSDTEVRMEISTDKNDPRTGRRWTEEPGG